jgi:hypothetical protein
LVNMSLGSFSDEELPVRGEAVWTHPMAHFLSLLLEEAVRMMNELSLPPAMAWRHIGLSEEEILEAQSYFDEQQAKEEAQMQAQLAARNSGSSQGSTSS